MAGPWDAVEDAPYEAPQSVERTIPNPVAARNALAPTGIKVIARGSPRVSTGQPPETFRDLTDAEKSKYGALANQISNRGRITYVPADVAAANKPGGQTKLTPQDMQYINGLRKQADETGNMSTLMGEFEQLNQNVETGGYYATPGVNAALSPFDSKRSRMSSIVSQITPAMRNGLPGAASDRDVAMFRDATVGLDKPYLTNKATAEASKAFAKRQGDYVAFLEAYAQKNGNVLGAREKWQDYAAKNPVFSKDLDKDGLLVPQKPVPWRQVFQELKPDSGKPKVTAPTKIRRYNPSTGGFDD